MATKERKLSIGLEEGLKAAFPLTPIPHRITESNRPDCQEIAAALIGQQWDTIPGKLLDTLSGDLPLYTPEYFCYVLPAYILHAYRTENRDFAWLTVRGLQKDSLHASVFSRFSSSQRDIIKRFLSWTSARLRIREGEDVMGLW